VVRTGDLTFKTSDPEIKVSKKPSIISKMKKSMEDFESFDVSISTMGLQYFKSFDVYQEILRVQY